MIIILRQISVTGIKQLSFNTMISKIILLKGPLPLLEKENKQVFHVNDTLAPRREFLLGVIRME